MCKLEADSDDFFRVPAPSHPENAFQENHEYPAGTAVADRRR